MRAYLLVVVLLAFVAASAFAESKPAATLSENLTVTGRGSARAVVSRAHMSLQVEVKSQDVVNGSLSDIAKPASGPHGAVAAWPADVRSGDKAAREAWRFCAACVQREVGRRATSILNFLTALNVTAAESAHAGGSIAPPKTSFVSLSPEYMWGPNSERSLTGYTGSTTITVDAPATIAAEVLDGAVAAGATSLSDVRLAATPDALAAAQLEADRAATLAAVSRAQSVLSALGVSGTLPIARVRVLSDGAVITRGGAGAAAGGMMLMKAAMADMSGGNAVPVAGDDVTVESSVEVAISFGEQAQVRA